MKIKLWRRDRLEQSYESKRSSTIIIIIFITLSECHTDAKRCCHVTMSQDLHVGVFANEEQWRWTARVSYLTCVFHKNKLENRFIISFGGLQTHAKSEQLRRPWKQATCRQSTWEWWFTFSAEKATLRTGYEAQGNPTAVPRTCCIGACRK